MLNTLKLGYVVEAISVIPEYDDNFNPTDTYLIVFRLTNGLEAKIFKILCNHQILELNMQVYVDSIITGVLYDDLNKELQITFNSNLGLCFSQVNIDSLILQNNK